MALVHVLHLNAGNLYGGVETCLATIARHRSSIPHLEHSFASCFDGASAAELRGMGTSVLELGPVRMSRPWTALRASAILRRFVAENRVDVVACHGSWATAMLGPAVRRTTNALLAYWVHGPPSPWDALHLMAEAARPGLLITNSQFTAHAVARRPRARRIETVYCPVDPPSPAATRSDVRSSLGAEVDEVVIIAACRLERSKGLHILIQALGELRRIPAWRCWIAGGAQRPKEHQYASELRRRAVELGVEDRVSFLGFRRDVRELLAGADVYCQPNLGPESFGLSFVEAQYAGLPVVTAPMGGALEIVDRTCGVLVRSTPTAVAAALQTLVKDAHLRWALGVAARARAAELCVPSRVLEKLHTILERALSGREG